MIEIVKDEDFTVVEDGVISIVGVTELGKIRDIKKSEEGDVAQVPVEFRRYVHGETIQQLPKGLIVYRGVRNGIYVDIRQLGLLGVSEQEAESLLGDAKTPERAQQHSQAHIQTPKREGDGEGGVDDTEFNPNIGQKPADNNLDFNEDQLTPDELRNERLSKFGRMLLEKYGIDVGFITNKGGDDLEAKTLVGEKILTGGFKHQQQIKMILLVDKRLVQGIVDKFEQQEQEKDEGDKKSPESKPEESPEQAEPQKEQPVR